MLESAAQTAVYAALETAILNIDQILHIATGWGQGRQTTSEEEPIAAATPSTGLARELTGRRAHDQDAAQDDQLHRADSPPHSSAPFLRPRKDTGLNT
jgi:hypothetical protein